MTGTPGHERRYCRDMVSWKIVSFELPCVVRYLLEGKGSETGCTKAACDNIACDAIFNILERLVCDNKLFTPLRETIPFGRSEVGSAAQARYTNFGRNMHGRGVR